MHILPFVVMVVAAVAFVVDYARTRSLVSGGLFLLDVGLILHFVIAANENLVTWNL